MIELPFGLIESQHGLITTDQLGAVGFARAEIVWLVKSKRLVRVSPTVLKVPGSPPGHSQRVLAAVLDAGPGSALSHSSALAWWDVPGFNLDDLHVTHTRDGVHRPRRLATHVHDVVLLPPHHCLVLDGVRVVSPARALFDLAGMPRVHPDRIERAVDNAWSKRLVSGTTLRRAFEELAKRGRPGTRLMRKILEDRGPDYLPPASGLEGRVIKILADNGLPSLRRQVDAGDEAGWIGRVDFADERLPFILEVQSERFHASRLDVQADSLRIDRLRAAGFVVATVTDVDVWQRPRRVVETVRDGRLAASRRSRPRLLEPALTIGGKNEKPSACDLRGVS